MGHLKGKFAVVNEGTGMSKITEQLSITSLFSNYIKLIDSSKHFDKHFM